MDEQTLRRIIREEVDRALREHEQRPRDYYGHIVVQPHGGCACPASHICANVACPRRLQGWP